jgi:adenylate kinase
MITPRRLPSYKRSTAPLIQLYKDLGLLTSIDAVGPAEEVCARTMAALQSRGPNCPPGS